MPTKQRQTNKGLGIAPMAAGAVADKLLTKENVNTMVKGYQGLLKGILGLYVVVGGFFVTRHFIRKAQREKSDKRAIIPNTPEWYAMQIGDAINADTWYSIVVNDDEEKLYRTLQEIPQGKADDVEKAFKQRYQKSILSEFDRALGNSEKEKAIAILNQKRK